MAKPNKRSKKTEYNGVLPVSEVKTLYVNASDLEQFIEYHTGRKYNIRSCEEAAPDTQRTYQLPSIYYTEEGRAQEMEEYEKWIETGKGEWKLGMILSVLAHNGHLPDGHYTILMGW